MLQAISYSKGGVLDSKPAPLFGVTSGETYKKPELRHINYNELSLLLKRHAALGDNEAKKLLEYLHGGATKSMVSH